MACCDTTPCPKLRGCWAGNTGDIEHVLNVDVSAATPLVTEAADWLPGHTCPNASQPELLYGIPEVPPPAFSIVMQALDPHDRVHAELALQNMTLQVSMSSFHRGTTWALGWGYE